jgi:hypothetical protein
VLLRQLSFLLPVARSANQYDGRQEKQEKGGKL